MEARSLPHPILLPLTIKHYYSFDQFAGDLKDDQLILLSHGMCFDFVIRIFKSRPTVTLGSPTWKNLKMARTPQRGSGRQKSLTS